MEQAFRFVGGKYDGGTFPVAKPVQKGLELRVRSLDPAEPSEFYALGEDGCFHVIPEAGNTAEGSRKVTTAGN